MCVCAAFGYCLAICVGHCLPPSRPDYFLCIILWHLRIRGEILAETASRTAHSISWRRRHRCSCALKSPYSHRQRRMLKLGLNAWWLEHDVGWMENFFNYDSPTDNFYLACMDIYECEWANTAKVSTTPLQRRIVATMRNVGFKCFSSTMPRAKYALWIINDRVELGTCARINHIFMHQIIKHFSLFFFFVVYFVRYFANQITFNMFSNVRAVCVCVFV